MKRKLSTAMVVSGLALVLSVGAIACRPGDVGNIRSTGSYPIDIFQEMHYNQSFRSQEPPRLAPAADSVPWRGFAEATTTDVGELPLFVKEVPLPRLKADAAALVNPVPRTEAVLEQAAELYAVNCSMCHGPTAGGDGIVGLLFQGYGVTPPPAFDSDRVRALSAGEAYWSVTNGFGFMPAFGSLLTPQERWTLIHLIGLSSEEQKALLEGSGE